MMRVPILPTIIVVAAAITMIALGIWQLGRAEEKAEMIARFETAQANPEIVDIEYGRTGLDYRIVRMECRNPGDWQAVAGRNARGQTGYAHRYLCPTTLTLEDARPTVVDVGWSRSPQEPGYQGGMVEGVMVTGSSFKIVATEPMEGLEPLARPNPNDLPNNHLAYAGQWFFFALTALAIYGFALRARMKKAAR